MRFSGHSNYIYSISVISQVFQSYLIVKDIFWKLLEMVSTISLFFCGIEHMIQMLCKSPHWLVWEVTPRASCTFLILDNHLLSMCIILSLKECYICEKQHPLGLVTLFVIGVVPLKPFQTVMYISYSLLLLTSIRSHSNSCGCIIQSTPFWKLTRSQLLATSVVFCCSKLWISYALNLPSCT